MFTSDEWVVAITVFLILAPLSAIFIARLMKPRFKIGETDSPDPNNEDAGIGSKKKAICGCIIY